MDGRGGRQRRAEGLWDGVCCTGTQCKVMARYGVGSAHNVSCGVVQEGGGSAMSWRPSAAASALSCEVTLSAPRFRVDVTAKGPRPPNGPTGHRLQLSVHFSSPLCFSVLYQSAGHSRSRCHCMHLVRVTVVSIYINSFVHSDQTMLDRSLLLLSVLSASPFSPCAPLFFDLSSDPLCGWRRRVLGWCGLWRAGRSG